MVSQKPDVQPRFGPSNSEKLVWGNQDPIWPISPAALKAVPSARIQYLARHKRHFSAWEDRWRTEELLGFFKRKHSPSSQYDNTVRLSTPRNRRTGSQEVGFPRPPHTVLSEGNRSLWSVDTRLKTGPVSPRLLQLSQPKAAHPEFLGNRQTVVSVVSSASNAAPTSSRVCRLSLPKVKESRAFSQLGRPEDSIWTISKAAKKASPSSRVELLSEAKQVSKAYVCPREPEWSPKTVRCRSGSIRPH